MQWTIHSSIHPSTHPSVHPLFHAVNHPSIQQSIHRSIQSIHLSVHPLFHSVNHSSIHPSIQQSIYWSIQSIHLSVHPLFHSVNHPSIQQSIHRSIQSIHLSVHPLFHSVNHPSIHPPNSPFTDPPIDSLPIHTFSGQRRMASVTRAAHDGKIPPQARPETRLQVARPRLPPSWHTEHPWGEHSVPAELHAHAPAEEHQKRARRQSRSDSRRDWSHHAAQGPEPRNLRHHVQGAAVAPALGPDSDQHPGQQGRRVEIRHQHDVSRKEDCDPCGWVLAFHGNFYLDFEIFVVFVLVLSKGN